MKKLILILLLIITQYSYSQLDYKFFTGSNEEEKDTIALENMQKLVEESAGLLEKEVDPEKYILGPNDIFSISIIASESILYDTPVTPEGKILLRGAGIVDVKHKTLAEGKDLIEKKLKETFPLAETFVSLSDIKKFKVSIIGQIPKPVTVAATAADRVSEVIDKAGGLEFDASIRDILLRRITPAGIEDIKVDLLKYYYTGDEDSNPYVKGGDKVVIPPNSEKNVIQVFGEVKAPNEFEFSEGDSLSTLLKFAQGFLSTSYLDSVELVRKIPNSNRFERTYYDLSDWRNKLFTGEPLVGDFPLNVGDRVFVRAKEHFNEYAYVIITGEIKYPGKYAIDERTDRVYDIITRAGGFTEDASIMLTKFIRQAEFENRDREMDRLWRLTQSEMTKDELRYYQSKARELKGLINIDFKKILDNPNAKSNILLIHKDSIIVPQKSLFVNVQGRVTNPGLIKYDPDYNYLDYIEEAGGYGYRADEEETLLTKPMGQKYLAEKDEYIIEPGDEILIPPKERLTFAEVIQVVSQVATIVGVVLTIVTITNQANRN